MPLSTWEGEGMVSFKFRRGGMLFNPVAAGAVDGPDKSSSCDESGHISNGTRSLLITKAAGIGIV